RDFARAAENSPIGRRRTSSRTAVSSRGLGTIVAPWICEVPHDQKEQSHQNDAGRVLLLRRTDAARKDLLRLLLRQTGPLELAGLSGRRRGHFANRRRPRSAPAVR